MSRASAGVSEVTGGATAGAGTSIGGTAGEPLRPREPVDLRAVLLRAVRFAGDRRAVVLRAVLLRAVLFLAADLRAVVFLAVDLRAVLLRAVLLRAVLFLAADLRAVVFLAVDLRAVLLRAVLFLAADLRAVVFLAVDLRAVVLRAGLLRAVVFFAVDLRAVLLRAVLFLAGDRFAVVLRAVLLRAVDFFAVLFLAAVRLVAVLRAVDFLAAVLRAVVFLAVLLFAVDLRAVVRFAAAGATSCPQPFLGNGTVLMAMLTPLACAFPHLRPCFVSRVAHTFAQVATRVATTFSGACRELRCLATQTQRLATCSHTRIRAVVRVDAPQKKFAKTRRVSRRSSECDPVRHSMKAMATVTTTVLTTVRTTVLSTSTAMKRASTTTWDVVCCSAKWVRRPVSAVPTRVQRASATARPTGATVRAPTSNPGAACASTTPARAEAAAQPHRRCRGSAEHLRSTPRSAGATQMQRRRPATHSGHRPARS